LPYTPPDNAERPARSYILEEIKDGMLVETHAIPRTKTFFVFGRLPMCDFPMDHQSISRYHCVLQFAASNHTTLVDLGSSHGTFVNKQQIRPSTPRTLDIGDQIRFGMSTRTWCLGTTD
ncbi:SMAD/FHA domain-containing protein, partial [Linderina pennispora]